MGSGVKAKRTIKRLVSVILSVIILWSILTVVSYAEWYTTIDVDYAYSANGKILTISKGEGGTNFNGIDCDLQEILEASIPDSIIIKESADNLISIDHHETDSVSNSGLCFNSCKYIGYPYISGFQYPSIIKNYSMRSYVNVFKFYYETIDGRKVTDNFDNVYEDLFGCDYEKQMNAENDLVVIAEFNRLFGTSFSTAAECRSFVKEIDPDLTDAAYIDSLYSAPTLVYCKKGSVQQLMCDYLKKAYILLDDSTSKVDSRTGAKATYNNSAFNVPVSMNINKVNSGKDSVVSYNISPTDSNGNKVQPNEALEISLPIPDGWNESDIQVRHEKDDGTTENLEFIVDDNNAVFYTSSCSVFSLVNIAGISAGEQTEEPTTEEPTTQPSAQPQKEDTKQSLNIFQRIIQWFKNLFAKLFGR